MGAVKMINCKILRQQSEECYRKAHEEIIPSVFQAVNKAQGHMWNSYLLSEYHPC